MALRSKEWLEERFSAQIAARNSPLIRRFARIAAIDIILVLPAARTILKTLRAALPAEQCSKLKTMAAMSALSATTPRRLALSSVLLAEIN